MTKLEIMKPLKKEKDEVVCLSLKCQQDQGVGVYLYVQLVLTYFVCVFLVVFIFVVDVLVATEEIKILLLNSILMRMKRIQTKQMKIL